LNTNKSPLPLSPRATLLDGEKPTWSEAWRRECEARDWIRRFKLHVKERGTRMANVWWAQMKEDILKARGQAGLDTLIADMNRIKNEKGGKN
jgi:hypothetical protein